MMPTSHLVRNNPFPYYVWDNFLDEDVAEKAHEEFPLPNSKSFEWETYDENSIKLMCQNRSEIEKYNTLNEIIDYLNSDGFIKTLSEIFGIDNLIADEQVSGGGLHLTKNGGFLRVHADFNIADNLPDLHRRLNLIYYLNKDWKDEYNGNLELWNTDLTKAEVKVKPDFNRMVCFNTQPEGDIIAYHGHPTPLNVPEGVYRKSIALYYYTKEKPNHTFADKHKTLYKDTK